MSMIRFMASHFSGILRIKPSQRFQTFLFNPNSRIVIPKHKHGSEGFSLGGRSLRYLSSTNQTAESISKAKRDTSVGSFPPGIPSGPSSDSWRSWLLGMVITVVVPFLGHKWGPLLKWTKEVEAVVEKVDDIVDAVEEVAETLDKVAEDISEALPEGGKLRKAVDFVEDLAERVAKDAHLAGDVIDKVEEAEKEVDSFLEPAAVDQGKVVAEGAAALQPKAKL